MVEYSQHFLKVAKKLSIKYNSLKTDLQVAVIEIEDQQDLGTPLGFNLFKKRVPNSSILTGKSGGFRIIIYLHVNDKIVLLSIYSKTQKETLSDDELRDVLKKYMAD